ncbi:MAG: type IV-A pilus assembly ATPase PilB [Deltaproteobacteria bacterium]|nr:type IV-A pilus assembly ATPase PilB [Deltaproteobacteria bacterium]
MVHPAMEKKSSFQRTIRDETGGRPKIGDMLQKAGLITRDQLNEALAIQKKSPSRLGSILVKIGYINEDTIVTMLSRQHGYPAVQLSNERIDFKAIKTVPYELAKKHLAFPISIDKNTLRVTLADPTNMGSIEELQAKTKMSIQACVSLERDIIDAYRKYYKISEEEYKSLVDFSIEEEEEETVDVDKLGDFGELASEAAENFEFEAGGDTVDESDQFSAGDAPIIKLVNGILLRAIKEGISDIHIEPFERAFYVRYRKDGVLYKSLNLPLTIKNALISRVKIMSNLNIAERRVPQDGRIKLKLGKKKEVDFRVSVLPTLFGESIVMRILDKGALNVDLTKLGFSEDNFKKFKKAITRPYGLILVTGPTGSGKTTTLYSALNAINKTEVKILTVEDPVEYNFQGINQVNVRTDIGMSFAAALRAFLRQDPDIIMVGEIRDLETAEIAIKAAMTGHLVFSTLHTNDCSSTIGRLIDMGVPPYMVSASVTLVLAQRLGRRICPKCKELVNKVSAEQLQEAGFPKEEWPDLKLYKGRGCPACNGTGYRGRVGFYEMMEMTDTLKLAVTSGVPESQLRKMAIKEGMKTLRMDALDKVRDGITSLDEVLSRTVLEKESLPAYLLTPDEQVYEDGDLIIKEGNTDNNFYRLIQGHLLVSVNGRVVGEITKPGVYFGEMSALMDQPRGATIRSKGKSVVKVFPGNKIRETLENYPDISHSVIQSLVQRLHDTNQRLSGQEILQ